mmetsp:Transcript_89645/g.254135  ORF Transcript_89645/g.254135 Transcript_89645/m.254135 type:complete len:294 (+) Transcript_89645:77-958(+)
MGRLDGKVAIITGGTSGIGLEAVRLFVKEGARVMFCGRGEEAGRRIAAECGPSARFTHADVTKVGDIAAVVKNTIDAWGQLDILFNNAGGGTGADIEAMTPEMIDRAFRLNFASVALMTSAALPHLKERQTSSIINNSSIAAKRAGYGDALYSAAKAAIDGYGRVAAMQLAKHGVRVNSVSPGATATPIFWSGSPGSKRGATLSEADNAKRQKKVEANILQNVSPLRVGRSGTGYDIATAALWLASDESVWYTGQDLIVDGGITTFDWPNKGWMADDTPVDPVPLRGQLKSKL